MAVTITQIAAYEDANGNRIEFTGSAPIVSGITVLFRGSNNVLTVDSTARIHKLYLRFDSHNGRCRIGGNRGVAPLKAGIRVGQDSAVEIGDDVSTTAHVDISAVEGTSVTIGDDVMIATGVRLRTDDGHPIFDVSDGRRVNTAKSIEVGNHVWLAIDSFLLGGARIGNGTVVGARALVTKSFPNNCILAGVPAAVIRRDVAWERPHLSVTPPYYKPDASTVQKSEYWHHTEG
ncbi:acyltransferase [Brachybacterium sacelli]|uniref:Acetyltransferase-like isoleucine patch superfamily enzyme n=1 Tax=Brachybacterium sacelli TaxID=173364 RepID=A0ABS4WVH6_9MICO|nr:acetyltransferase-like isoleucine patch superfamily enzyme [Brachybacterium sacelli]